MAMVNNVPDSWIFSAFSIGRHEMPYVAAAVLAGGNVRVGLEDNLYLERGVLATNDQLVSKAAEIIDRMGVSLMTPDEVRAELKLEKRSPALKGIRITGMRRYGKNSSNNRGRCDRGRLGGQVPAQWLDGACI